MDIRRISRAALFVAVSAALLTSGCGSPEQLQARDSSEVVWPTAEEVEVPQDVASTRDAVEASYERWAGTTEQQQAFRVIEAFRQNGHYDECMQAKGHQDYHWQRGIGAVTPWPALSQTAWLRDPLTDNSIEGIVASGRAVEVEAYWNRDDLSEAEYADGDACREQVGLPEGDGPWEATGLEELREQWIEMLRETVWPLTGDSDAFAACVADASGGQFKGEDLNTMVEARDAQLAEVTPPQEDLLAAGNAGPGDELPLSFEPYLEVRQSYLDAAWECSEPVYSAGMRSLPEPIAAFESDHAEEVERLERYWAQVEAYATEEYGFDPDDPHLDSQWPSPFRQ